MTVQTRVSLFVEIKAKPGKEAEVAAALMQRGTELLARAPEIRHAEVLADKLVAGK